MSAPAAETRVLVCDESPSYAESLASFLGAGGDLDVVGVCGTGEEALAALDRLAPDLVTMELELPGMGGLRAIEAIMRSHPVPILVLASAARRGSQEAAAALAAGAIEALPKTHVRLEDPDGPSAVALRHRLRRLARARVAERVEARAERDGAPDPGTRPTGATVVGICASTGGPRALETVLAGLPADYPLPVLVVQHMAVGFISGLIRWLDERVPMRVAAARDGQPARPGIWFPPDDAHLRLEPPMRLGLDRETVAGAHRPSADVLLESLAEVAGRGAVGVVLTGMGSDGARGVEALCRAGGAAIAQDEQSSAVFGMPRAAAAAGAELSLPLSEVAGALRQVARAKR